MPHRYLSLLNPRIPLCLSLLSHGFLLLIFVPVGLRMKPKTAPAADEHLIAMVEMGGGSLSPRLPILAPNGDPKAGKDLLEPRPVDDNLIHKKHLAKLSGSQSQAARAQDRGTGPAAGNGSDARDATPAFPTFYPRPPVTDRTLLPATDRKVVMDVKLSAAGEVLSETLVSGLGNALDQLALNAVKSWRFQPATLNGQPVASEAEVVFTFGPNYPLT